MPNDYLKLLEGGQSANTAAGGNPYLDMLQAGADEQERRFRAATALGVSADPDRVATARRVAGYLGTVPPAVEALPAEAERAAKLKAIDDDTRGTPVLRSKYTDADFARLAHDDSGPLATLESAVARAARYAMGAEQGGGLAGDVGRFGRAALAGVGPRFGASVYGAAAYPFEAVGLDRAGAWLRNEAAAANAVADRLRGPMPDDVGVFRRGLVSGAESVGQNLATLPMGFGKTAYASGEQLMLSAMGMLTFGQTYLKGREAGQNPGQAGMYGLEDALAEVVTERFMGAHGLVADAKAGMSAGKVLVRDALREVPGEVTATLWQNFNEWQNLNPGKSAGDFLREQPEAALETIVATLVGAGAQSGAVRGMAKLADKIGAIDLDAQAAEQRSAALLELARLAEASKLRERDPATFSAFMQEAAEQGMPRLYVDPKALQQAGVDLDALAQALPSIAPQIAEAQTTGGDIVIPTGDFAALVPGQAFEQPLVDNARTAPDAMSRAEAQAYMAERGDALQAEMQRVLQEQQGDQQFQASRDQVAAEFQRQLDEVKRFTPDVNKAYATLLGSFYAVTAARMGTTPAELLQRYPLRIAAQGVGPLEQAGTPAFDRWFGDSKVVDAKGKPLVVYHGAPDARFVQSDGIFKSPKERLGMVENDPERAFFFAADRKVAATYADDRRAFDYQNAEPRVLATYLTLKNPLVIDHGGQHWHGTRDAIQRAKDGGHDGVIIRNVVDDYLTTKKSKPTDVYVAFHPEQIKSATENRGTYDPADPNILRQSEGARGFLDPQAGVLGLLKGADLSTFIHESGHFFLEVQADLAARIEGVISDGAVVTEGEREILDDMNRLLKWFGVEATPEQSALARWHSMTLDEKRSAHEQFARGFEAYGFEGRAPSVELQPLFQRFRAWLVNIYKQLKGLNVELTDEVRGVMDRMIASTEQIREAEAARQMGALFETPEQAGMTAEEFKAYHDLAVDATQQAIQNLQVRGLRDMQWLQNARSRVLKQLQAQHDELRRETRAEVRTEVMSQPVYRAWQFLTSKGLPGERATPEGKAPAGVLDVTRDSLLTAVAKLGGLARDSAAKHLGVHPDNFSAASGVFGKPIFRKEGGRDADSMATALIEAGYLTPDENGKADLTELEEKIDAELRGEPTYSIQHDWSGRDAPVREGMTHGKLRTADVKLDNPDQLARLQERRMVQEKDGLHPDVVAELFGYGSGDELVRALAEADAPRVVIEAMTDQRMLERHGDLATPEGLQRAADEAIHNEARAKFVATELAALERAQNVREKVPGQRRTIDVMARAARTTAAAVLARLKVRDIRPGQYAAAEARAARASQKAMRAGDLAEASAQKRNQLIQGQATKQAYEAQEEIRKALEYLRRFDKRPKSVDPAYLDQIDALLERFDLKQRSLKEVDRRKTLATWLEAQREQGLEPEIPPDLLNEAFTRSWRDMTLEELRGLRDTVKQIEHLGKLKNKLLTAKEQREFEAIRDEIADSIEANARGRKADTRTPATTLGRALKAVKDFGAAHIKAATWARVFDGGQDGGPVWEYLIRSANERADMETTMRAEATAALHAIVAPLFERGRLGGKGRHYPSIGRSMTREQVIAMALNVGNAGNLQRMLGGEGWTLAQIQPVLATLTPQDWRAVQAIWDHFESYRPQIGAKERRVYGKEPEWVQPGVDDTLRTVVPAEVRGGYYPIKYDPLASNRAEQHNEAEAAKRQLQGAYTSATTRRGFTKARAEEVRGRPLLYSLAGVYSGVNDVIHDLAWHEWLIDANKILRSDKIDGAIRQHYGPAAVRQLKTWVADVATGEAGLQVELDGALGRLRHGVSVAGLGFNVMSAAMQPLGLSQSIVRVGVRWVGKGLRQYMAAPIASTREVNEKSEFMANRARTRFRELNELRNQVEGQTVWRERTGRYAYWLMMRCQQMVDVPTWLGAYEKAVAEGNAEDRAIALADQAVIDAQGGGQVKDLSAIERGGPAQKLFTTFYSFINTALNVGVAQGMTAKSAGKLAADMLMLYTVPAVLGSLLKDALTPGDAGDDDKLLRKLLGEQLSYLMGLFVVVREFTEAGKIVTGLSDRARDYSGPAGLRLVSDTTQAAKQLAQGEFDDSLRKALVNLTGDLFALPAAQVNRSITGAKALADGETTNPAALVFGFQKPH